MAIRDVVTMGFGSWGTIPFVTRLGYGSAEAATNPLIGIWSNVIYLESRSSSHELEARSNRLTMEARYEYNDDH